MKGNQITCMTPTASFVVEREPCKGYRVTFADGPDADEWKERALTLLDAVGQPDPKGSAEYVRLVGPVTPSGEYVSVSVTLMPNGEARFHQAWYRVPKRSTHPARAVSLLILVAIVFFSAGAFARRAAFIPDRSPHASGTAGGKPGQEFTDPPMADPRPNERQTKLRKELAASRDVRARLKEYLSQEGFAVDLSMPVVDEMRSVKLIADLDRTPPPQESIRLSNVEVAKLITLIEVIDDWEAYPGP